MTYEEILDRYGRVADQLKRLDATQVPAPEMLRWLESERQQLLDRLREAHNLRASAGSFSRASTPL